jgi:hypothetical protein
MTELFYMRCSREHIARLQAPIGLKRGAADGQGDGCEIH